MRRSPPSTRRLPTRGVRPPRRRPHPGDDPPRGRPAGPARSARRDRGGNCRSRRSIWDERPEGHAGARPRVGARRRPRRPPRLPARRAARPRAHRLRSRPQPPRLAHRLPRRGSPPETIESAAEAVLAARDRLRGHAQQRPQPTLARLLVAHARAAALSGRCGCHRGDRGARRRPLPRDGPGRHAAEQIVRPRAVREPPPGGSPALSSDAWPRRSPATPTLPTSSTFSPTCSN